MATYCIGDVQGCYEQLRKLLDILPFNPQQDTLWFTGDLVNRGPNSLEVLRFIHSLGDNAIVVLGNHDLHLLSVVAGERPNKKQDTFDDVLVAPDCNELCEWLRHKPLLHYDAKLNFALAHAGIAPQWDLAKAQQLAQEVSDILTGPNYIKFFQHMYGDEPNLWDDSLHGWERARLITNYFTRMRYCTFDGALEMSKKDNPKNLAPALIPWFKLPQRANLDCRILFGHWAALQGETNTPNVFALDTGCVWGHCLSAMRLEDQKCFKIPCSK